MHSDAPTYCAHEWPWTRAALRRFVERGTIRGDVDRWVGHVCGRPPGHTGRHSCLARECDSWNN